ncbi:MAG: hypothetical protein HZC02_03765 [Candidatus Levybacteria bacterium]|nr:hypothetical protein [Candidatus Levybacteria bacterium]
MIDVVQLILFIVIVTLTVLLVVLGVQVFFILRELRKTIQKTNNVLEDTRIITESISKPVSSLSSLSLGIKASSIMSIAKLIKGLLTKDEEGSDKKKSKE